MNRIKYQILKLIGSTPEQKAAEQKKRQEILAAERKEQEYRDRRREALLHSSACMSKIEYILGIIPVDPHPDKKIEFDPNFPWPERDD